MEKRPGEFETGLSRFFLPSLLLLPHLPSFFAVLLLSLDNWILMVDLPDYRLILDCKASIKNIPCL